MIQMQSVLNAADNSGAKRVMCIKVLGGSRRRYASVGDIVVCSVREALPGAKVKKGDIARAVIVRTAKEIARSDGTYIRFDGNSAVLARNTGFDTQSCAQVIQQVTTAEHMIGDTVAEQDVVITAWCFMQERVKTNHTPNMCLGQVQGGGQLMNRCPGYM